MRTLRLSLARAVYRARSVMGAVAGTFTPAGTLTEGRQDHTATLLPDGRVLVVGGSTSDVFGSWTSDGDWTDTGSLRTTAEVWDPTTATFTPAGTLTEVLGAESATLLPDGRVLVVGDVEPWTTAAEAWDPVTAAFTPAGRLAGARGCAVATLTLLPDGRVLVIGRSHPDHEVPAMAEVWDPATGWSAPAGAIAEVRTLHTATLLPDGRVLVVGGQYGGPPRDMAEVWSPAE